MPVQKLGGRTGEGPKVFPERPRRTNAFESTQLRRLEGVGAGDDHDVGVEMLHKCSHLIQAPSGHGIWKEDVR